MFNRHFIFAVILCGGVAFQCFSKTPNQKKKHFDMDTTFYPSQNVYTVKINKVFCSPKVYLVNKDGIVLTKNYRDIGKFSDGLAEIVYSDIENSTFGKHGYIDKTGKEIIPTIYPSAGTFSNGLAWVIKLDGNIYRLHYINTEGKVIYTLKIPEGKDIFTKDGVSPIHPCGFESNDEMIWYKQGPGIYLSTVIDSFIQKKLIESNGALVIFDKNYYGMLDKQGILRTPVVMTEINASDKYAGDGLYRAKFNELYGFIDSMTGELVIQCFYEDALKPVLNRIWIKKNDKWGCIDKTGRLIIPTKYDYVSYYSKEGLACVGVNKKFGHVDRFGKVVTPLTYDMTFPFVSSLAPVKKEGKYGVVNQKGQLIIDTIYNSVSIKSGEEVIAEQYGIYWKIDKNQIKTLSGVNGTLLAVVFLVALVVYLISTFKGLENVQRFFRSKQGANRQY